MFNFNDIFPAVWDNKPGGKVIREYSKDGIDYVVVVFKGNEDKEYLYIKE